MASTASDSPPSSPAAPTSAFLDDRPLFLDQGACSFFPGTTSREPLPPAPGSSAAARKPPRKRPRASRRPPTTVLTIDTSNFRAMVQEFTGIPAPPPFAPHLGPGVLFGAPHDPTAAGTRAPFDLLMRPSSLKLPGAPHASPPAGSFPHSLFPNSNSPDPAGSSSELYGGFAPALSGAVPRYDGGFEAEEDERAGHGHGLFSSLLHAGDRYHSH
ncbi:VQ motif-containing protein 22-like [Panicum miliaceum]|uniref:VQ motif-containing protein 22-like n=1 Tax=Panicum miliaceum TaxID=4540 RepID=A0A3L6TDV3_PANMI|nr:VQ motif-containing protein 22-like [Panicum miliaceum]